MRAEELQAYLIGHYRELADSIRGGWYKPKPVKRVEIPKPDGGKRQLGVPTVIDRMVQQALVQVLQALERGGRLPPFIFSSGPAIQSITG